ncbi:MAG: 4Fe-4S binding protein [Zoogloeaceae bacterium]|jgi:polyferredoxin|nr:4Fe-4S binding protein [Zoogloeaceae bacterium]
MTEVPLRFYPANAPGQRGKLERLGLFLRRQRPALFALQWGVVLCYGTLVVAPAFFPLPPGGAHIWDNLRLFSQFIFWGLWWPGVMLATVGLGRVWCGFLCPEGFLSELASRHGRGKAVPGWLKWAGWPFVAFVATTVYGQLTSVYEYAEAALLVLGGSTLAAVLVGLIYGRGKRVWCRYLCPASGVFAVLAKLSPLHYQVDRATWEARNEPPQTFNCPPLVDVRRMVSASECHACARCAGQRDAVKLTFRSPFAEILNPHAPARSRDALTLLFGVLGIATTAFQWTVSPWFLRLKMALATWLVEHDAYALLNDNAPWWLLTHYPEANDLFTWLDGLMVLAYLLGGGVLLGGLLLIGPTLAARLSKTATLSWQRFTLTLTPLAAASVVLGLSMTTATQLRGEHLALPWLSFVRVALLAVGALSALALALALLRQAQGATRLKKCAAFSALCLPSALMTGLWSLAFWVW